MDEIIIPPHAADEMQGDSITEDDLYEVVSDYDDIIEHVDGRTEYSRILEDGRYVVVVMEDDGQTVVTTWWDKHRSRRRRRRR